MAYIEHPRLTNFWIVHRDGESDLLIAKEFHSYNRAFAAAQVYVHEFPDEKPTLRISMKAHLQQRPSAVETMPPVRESIRAADLSADQQHDLEWTMRTMAAEVADFAEFEHFVVAPMGRRTFLKLLDGTIPLEQGQWHWYPHVLALKNETDLVLVRMHVDFNDEMRYFNGAIT